MNDIILEIKKEEVELEIRSSVAMSGGGGGAGTVTRVAVTVPQGFSVTGSPITGAGTIGISYAAGYAVPTIAKQNLWDEAYDSINKTYYDKDNAREDTLSGECIIWEIRPNSVYSMSNVASLEVVGYGYGAESFECTILPETFLIIDAEESFQIAMTRIESYFLTDGSSLSLTGGHKYLVIIRGNIWDIKQLS